MLPQGIRAIFRLGRRQNVVAEVDDEIAFHLESKTRALMARGLGPEAAREEALRQFGDLLAARAELIRTDRSDAAARSFREWRGDWWMDIRYGARSLTRTPGLTGSIIVMLALGIGANAAMLGILDRLLLRAPPHLADPGTLVRVALTSHRPGRPDYTRTLAPFAEVDDYARAVPALTVAGYSHPRQAALGSGDDSVAQSRITSRYFQVLGAPAALGRTLDTSDASGPPVVVVSDAFWRRRFAASARALGQDLDIGQVHYTVVGVMPPGFSGAEVNAADVWTMLEHGAGHDDWRTTRYSYFLEIVARLKTTADRVAAIAQIEGARRAYAASTGRPGDAESAALTSIIPGRNSTFDGAGVRLAIAVSVVSALLLLIAVANVTNLLLVRAVSRLREFAVRAALGAGRGRLLRYVVIESLLLAGVGGLAAAAVGYWAGTALRSLLLPAWHWALPPLGWLPGLLAAALSLTIGLVTGLVPGSLAGGESALGALRTGIQRGRGSRGRVRASLVAVQVAVSVILVTGTGLFVRSLVRAEHEDHGIALQGMIEAAVSLEGNAEARTAHLEELLADLRRVPGVSAATAITAAPLLRLDFSTLRVEGRDSALGGLSYAVPAGFLSASGLRLRSGREFSPDDRIGTERVALVDSVLEARFWPGASAAGHCVYMERDRDCVRIVGVVAHVRTDGLRDQPVPQIYVPVAQTTIRPEYSLLLRTSGSSAALIENVWRTVAHRVTGYSRASVKSYDDLLAPQLRPWRVGTTLFAVAALLALLLSSVGTFAVTAFAVRQRTHEFGVRRALGARAIHIVRLVVGEGVVVAGAGVTVGIVLAWFAARFAAPLLYNVNPRDPFVLVAASASLLIVALAAALGAAALALRVDPRQALQAD